MKCPDRKGLVRSIAHFISSNGGNILHADHHINFELTTSFPGSNGNSMTSLSRPMRLPRRSGRSPMPTAWNGNCASPTSIPAVAVFVSTLGHCLVDLLHRWSIGEFPGSVVAVVSNHLDLKRTVEQQAIPYHHFPITAQNKRAQEAKQLELLSSLGVDLVIFARYMQVVSDEFIARYPNRIINIHHSFLPAFIGSSPYARAYERGVKLIGATGHYVTPVLDAGPIIEQDVMRVTHRDTLEDLIRKGRDLERVVLARAVRLDLDRRVLAYANKTVVFE